MNLKYVTVSIMTIVIIVITLVIGCTVYISSKTNSVELRVFVASSLIHVVKDMAFQFEEEYNVKLIVNTDSSSALFTQIMSGVSVDVFMSADQKWVNQLQFDTPGLLNGQYKNFTTNSLCVILAPGNPANITSLADLAKPNVKLVLAAPSVPVGAYANDTIWKIDSTWGNSSSIYYVDAGIYKNFNTSFYRNVVSYENSVEQVVGKVSLGLGIADAGIVFVSDAIYNTNAHTLVSFIEIPLDVNTKGTYGIGVVGSTEHPELAQKFMNYWFSEAGEELLTKYGFNS